MATAATCQHHHGQRSKSPTISTGSAYSTGSNSSLPAHFMEDGMLIVDPLTRKVVIPYDHIYETRAFQRGSVPSLCMLFQNGRCRQGHMCYQVHADPTYVQELRSRMPQRATCCISHSNETVDFDFTEDTTVHVPEIAWNEGNIPIERFSVTAGLKNTLNGSEHATICRAGHLCRFGEDCRYLHVCRELESLVHGPHKPPSYPTTPLHTATAPHAPHTPQQHTASYPDLVYLEGTPNTLGASMASLGNSFTSIPSPLQSCTLPPAEELPREGSWCHDPYQWRCLAPVEETS